MKLRPPVEFSALVPAIALWLAPCAANAELLVNGSFENLLNGWLATGNVSIESSSPYSPTDGGKLVAFNAQNSTPDGSIQQTVNNPGGRWHRLSFDVGNLSYKNLPQRIRVEVTEVANGVTYTPLSEEITVPPGNPGSTRWLAREFVFTPRTHPITLTFTDLSDTTDSTDLVLDHLRLVSSCVVGFESLAGESTPSIAYTSSPTSIDGKSGGNTPNSAWYFEGTDLAISAPPTLGGMVFHDWWRDGWQFSTLPDTVLRVESDTTMTARYGSPLALDSTAPIPIRGFAGSGPFTPLNHQRSLTNYSDEPMDWSTQLYMPGRPEATPALVITPTGGTLDAHSSTQLRIATTGYALQLEPGLHRAEVRIVSSAGTQAIPVTFAALDPQHIAFNGDFEAGLDEWTHSGSVRSEDAPAYHLATGLRGVSFNAMNQAPDGVLWQSLLTEAGVTYALDFDVGVYAFNTATQKLHLSVCPTEENFTPLIEETIQLTGQGGGTTHWIHKHYQFTALGPETHLVFEDQSTVTNGIDTALDGLRVSIPDRGLIVTTLADENDDAPGLGAGDSLREMLAEAARRTGTHVIRFAPDLDGGTITVQWPPLAADSDVAIDASTLPNGITLSGAGSTWLFHNTANTAVQNVILRDGNNFSTLDPTSGGIMNGGSLTLFRCCVRDNSSVGSGAGLYSTGPLAITECLFSGNHSFNSGGALACFFSDATISASTFRDNSSATSGGALACNGSFGGAWMVLRDSTVANNVAWQQGGGYAGLSGYKQSGNLKAINSTFSGNRAASSGGAIEGGGSVDLHHCTIAANTCDNPDSTGGGVSGAYSMVVLNTIIADNHAGTNPDLSNCDIHQEANSFTGDDPRLAPLGDYGGLTFTMPPLPGSPVINAATLQPGTPAHDQRGAYRPHAQLPDIGAVEACAFGFMPLADTDSDSIPDCLEPAYQMTVGIDDSQRDSDGDGSPDAEEIANMTDPLDGSSLLKILSLTPAGAGAPGEFVVSFTAFPGLSYTLECDQNLDFHGPTARVIPLGTAIDFIGNTQVELMPEKDFIRIRRNP